MQRTTARDAELLSTLAVAYEGAARFADALGVWSDAITPARAGGRTDLLPGLEAAVAVPRKEPRRRRTLTGWRWREIELPGLTGAHGCTPWRGRRRASS